MTTVNQRFVFQGGIEIAPLINNNPVKNPNGLLLYSNNGSLNIKNYNDDVLTLATEAPIIPTTINQPTYAMNNTENYILVDSTGLSNITITLPPSNSVSNGKVVNITDLKRTASIINILVNADVNIQGDTDVLMNVNGMSLTFLFDGNEWIII